MAGSEFNLRVAWALTEEVRNSYDTVFAEARQKVREGNSEGFLQGIKGAFEGRGMINALNADLGRAIALCDAMGAGMTIPHPENPDVKVSAASVKSTALFYKGMIRLSQGATPDALELMNQSLAVEPDQSTLYNIGLCFLQLKEERGDRGLGAKVLGRTLAKMVISGSEQVDQAIDAFRQCVEMNSESEIGVRAGMELARLEQL
ncbi:MAG: hypothetical protein O3A46_00005 [Candidatus Poribacteria bacterium]|nr:hypothetical protein [Candidatus Poribacteria bacterium]